ncbi:MAG: restriction endonuclease subunit S [Muribaculaceae bacterium]
MDSEYYKKIYTEYEDKLFLQANDKLKNKASFLIGPFGSAYDTSNYTEVPVYRYVRGQDVKPFVLKDIEPRYMTKEDYERLKKYALKPKDILVSVVGTLGNACIVKDCDVPAIFSCKSTVIRAEEINPYYLVAYLNSKYGRTLLLRNERGAIQKGLNLDDLKELDIPLFSNDFYMQVQNLLISADTCLEQAKMLYIEAETTLEKELGFDSYVEPKEICSIKSFSEAFGKSGRLDAEYYQEKFDVLFERLAKYNTKRLVDIVNISKSIEPGSDYYTDEGIPFIRVSDLSKYGVSEPAIHLLKGTDNSLGIPYPKKDTILLSKDGSVGIAYKLEKDADFVTSGALLHLTLKKDADVLPDYLTLVLNSKLYRCRLNVMQVVL